jgi:Protein of unknown function (DUF1254)
MSLEAWIAVDDKTPVILEVPEVKGSYCTAQILDEWAAANANLTFCLRLGPNAWARWSPSFSAGQNSVRAPSGARSLKQRMRANTSGARDALAFSAHESS